MKFKLIVFFVLFLSCSSQLTTYKIIIIFAYIYNELDFNQKIIRGKMNEKVMQISHQNLKTGTLVKLINPKNKESVVLKNVKRIKYPDFYKVLITEPVAIKLDLNKDVPLLEIFEIKKNKSFVAKKAKIYNEEKISSKAPVASVEISNISKNKTPKINDNFERIYIHIASFYSTNTAEFMRKRIKNEVAGLKNKNLKIKKVNSKETQVILGPYKSVNLLKNDYIKLKSFGFEELDIFTNE